MALYAFDGTWNQEKDNDTAYTNTNVARFFDAYHARSGTDDVYEQGIGTKLGAIGHAIGGAFGAGELDRLERAYSRAVPELGAQERQDHRPRRLQPRRRHVPRFLQPDHPARHPRPGHARQARRHARVSGSSASSTSSAHSAPARCCSTCRCSISVIT